MKRIFLFAILAVMSFAISAQSVSSGYNITGKCGNNIKWTYVSGTLTLSLSKPDLYSTMYNYDKENIAPWNKKKLDIKKVYVNFGVLNIGSYAFAGCEHLQEIILPKSLKEIGWGAFSGCSSMHNVVFPQSMDKIGPIAFANCTSLNSITIPANVTVGDQAFLNCNNVVMIDVNPSAVLGNYVFAREVTYNGEVRHALYEGEIRRLPANINSLNCNEYGISKVSIDKSKNGAASNNIDYDVMTADVDSLIPECHRSRLNTYALIIGNQNYRFAADVPFAIHDARVFRTYCEKTLGIPSENIHICEDATKQMIQDDEMEWINSIQGRDTKRLIVYYAGHGAPDIKNNNRAYLLPTDVRGIAPQRGIALDDFYAMLGDLGFEQTSVFIDACFSGINRDNGALNSGLRAVEVEAEKGKLSTGNVVVFSAAQGNETAQGYPDKGHGLFTYYLLKNLQTMGDNGNYGSLSETLYDNVSKKAPQLRLRKSQTPSTSASEAITDWQSLTF